MFDHVTIRVADRAASDAFYRTVLDTVGIGQDSSDNAYAEWNDFGLAPADDAHPPTWGVHLGFVAPSPAHVDAFWHAGRALGAPDDGAPGPRPQYREDYYGGFLRDPDDNSAEAVHDGALRTDGGIDHVWIRVADVAAAREFYTLLAPYAGFELHLDRPDWVRFRATSGHGGSLTFVPGEPTRNVHLAFGADEEAVRAFHAAALAAGHPDNGAPGERLAYHPGYYAAFVLDPAGHNVELVDHHR